MSSSRKIINPFTILPPTAPVVGDLVSAVTVTTSIDRVNLYIKATTGAIGTPKVQASPDELDLIEHPGVWFDLPITFTAADGLADFEYFVDIQVSSIRRIRVVFTGSNTAGLVSAVISGIGV